MAVASAATPGSLASLGSFDDVEKAVAQWLDVTRRNGRWRWPSNRTHRPSMSERAGWLGTILRRSRKSSSSASEASCPSAAVRWVRTFARTLSDADEHFLTEVAVPTEGLVGPSRCNSNVHGLFLAVAYARQSESTPPPSPHMVSAVQYPPSGSLVFTCYEDQAIGIFQENVLDMFGADGNGTVRGERPEPVQKRQLHLVAISSEGVGARGVPAG